MKSVAECLPCILRQVQTTARFAGADTRAQREVLLQTAGLLPSLDLSRSPAHNSTRALKLVPVITGCPDPYAKEKREFNERAMALLPLAERLVAESSDRLQAAALAAVAGNVIDLGIADGRPIEVEGSLRSVFREGFAVNHIERLRSALARPRRVVYLLDNTGEIVFDRELIKTLVLQGHGVTLAVHEAPILNDALLEDARFARLEELAPVISTGSDWIGMEWETCSKEFQEVFQTAEVVIGKGQGNFETLEEHAGTPPETYFILKAKCHPVARSLGVRHGQVVLKRKDRPQ